MIVKGQKINDRYQIIRSIGEGGMANVYLAYDTILDRNVAVKILRGDLADDEKFVRKFQREAISASSLSHPNIVEVYDVGEDDGKYFIVMEYVDGRTLKSLIKKRGALTLPEVIDIMLQLTSAIAHAHDSYIIHRDIKPQNVLILDDGMVKITDFGIAMALNSNELTQTNSVMGSVHYLPPEQANGSGSTIKSDIYSLGVLMFELLTGKVPFKGDNAVEIAIKQMKEPIPSVCKINPEIPQSVENIILKACAKNPKNRYENVREMHEDLKTCLSKERLNEARSTYQYAEQEVDEGTKRLPNLSRLDHSKVLDELEEEEKKDKKTNRALIITGAICAGLAALLIAFFFVIPKLTNSKEVEVPDVTEMTEAQAEQALEAAGLEVATKTKSEYSDDVEEDKVIKTEPSKNRSVKKGTKVTLVLSKGKKTFKAENYVGKNYYEVKAQLEAKGINVLTETKEVSNEEGAQENIILEQKTASGAQLEVGTKLSKGDTVTLVIPDIYTQYPDFVNDHWNLSNVQTFCNEHNIVLNIEYKETNDYIEGTIISQSRVAGSKVVANTALKVVVAKAKPTPTPTPTPSPTPTATVPDSGSSNTGA